MRCAFRVRTRKADPAALLAAAPKRDALDEAEELRRQAEEGLEQRLAAHGPAPGLDRGRTTASASPIEVSMSSAG